jgi:hypothetical protein
LDEKAHDNTASCKIAKLQYQFRVRGLAKVKAAVLWYVLAHNLMRAVALRAERENQKE